MKKNSKPIWLTNAYDIINLNAILIYAFYFDHDRAYKDLYTSLKDSKDFAGVNLEVNILLGNDVIFRYKNHSFKKTFKPRAGFGVYDKYYRLIEANNKLNFNI